MFEATVYILRCADGSYYTGLMKQPIEARLWEHNEGIYEGFTKPRRPVTLVFTETYDRMLDAIARERQIKGWSRAKKEALIALDYEALPALARNRQVAGGLHDLDEVAGFVHSPLPDSTQTTEMIPAEEEQELHWAPIDPSTSSG